MWELDHKEGWLPKNWCFWVVVLKKTLENPWTARRSNQSILKEINPEHSLEGLMQKLKLQYFGTWCEEPTHWKRPWCWERLNAKGEGVAEDKMARHIINSKDVDLSKLWEIAEYRRTGCAAVHRVAEFSLTEQLSNNRLLVTFLVLREKKCVYSVDWGQNTQSWENGKYLTLLGNSFSPFHVCIFYSFQWVEAL